jgi:carboxypeptidase Q
MWWWAVAVAKRPEPVPTPPPPAEVAGQLIGMALASTEAHDDLRELCDDVGHRLAGSPGMAKAVEWGLRKMAEDGLATRSEPVTVPTWLRGVEEGAIVAPVARPLHLLQLGGSPPTPPGGLTADLLVVGSFEELKARAAEVPGTIVLFDVPFTTYGETVRYRGRGPTEAAALGAVGALVRSVTTTSLDTPHTGMTRVPDAGERTVPSAAVTIENATQLRRLAERGPVRVHVELGGKPGPDAVSANTIGEWRGREKPEEIVVLACHLDSWDVGQGAQDDGAGCVTAMQAAHLIASLPWRPRRTLRVVLYTNEESGLAGAEAYDRAHAAETHHAAIESDLGSGQPLGFHVHRKDGESVAADLAALSAVPAWLAPIGAGSLDEGHSGADIGLLAERGALCVGLAQDPTNYWPIHHTEADTFDKVDPTLLARNVAAMAVLAWTLADQ